MKSIGIGIIGGGLMGREMASTFGRWCALLDFDVQPELVAVADVSEPAREWFRRIPSVKQLTADYREMLANPAVEVVYAAVPHNLHEQIYLDVLAAGKDLLAEKPFGIDLPSARRIVEAIERTGRFVRCSSEMPFFPGAQRIVQLVKAGVFGRVLDVVSGFHHSSDLDATKAANWKRQSKTCGEGGVLNDLGMHVCHLPLRFGWKPRSVFAQLQRGYEERPDGRGGTAKCDTWDNAALHTWVNAAGNDAPLRLEMKRLAGGEMNSWFIQILGTQGGARFSTKEPKTLWQFENGKEQCWRQIDVGFSSSGFKTVTGGIFEPGFPDVIQQMWAAFIAERQGQLGDRFGCVTPAEALGSHEIFAAALASHAEQRVVPL